MPRPESKTLGGLVALAQVAQGVGHGEGRVDLVVGLVPSPVEVGLVHIVDVQLFQVSCQFNSLAHDLLLFLFSLGKPGRMPALFTEKLT